MGNATKWYQNWYTWIFTIQGVLKNGKCNEIGQNLRYMTSVHFLGHPVWWKYTLNKYIYIVWIKSTSKAPVHKDRFFRESYIDDSHISQFIDHFIAFPIFFGHPAMWKYTLNECIYIFCSPLNAQRNFC